MSVAFITTSTTCTLPVLSYIGADFSVHFTTNFTLSVVEMPRTIKLHLVDTTSLLATAVAEIFIPIPDRDQSSSRAVLESYRFSSQLAHEYNHTAVGSGECSPCVLTHSQLSLHRSQSPRTGQDGRAGH